MVRKTAAVVIVVIVGAALAGCSFQKEQFLGDAPPAPVSVGFAQASSLQDEGSANIEVLVRLSRSSDEPIDVDYRFSGGDAMIDVDYTATDGRLSFSAGQTELGIPLQILPDNDETETNESIEITLSMPTNANLGLAQHTITISSIRLPRVGFASATSSGPEGSTATYMVTLDRPPLLAGSVTFAPKAGSTASSFDYTMPASTMLTFAEGTTSQQFTVTTVDDALFEDQEALDLELASTQGLVIDQANQVATRQITDNDTAPSVSISASTMAAEGNANNNVMITVTQSAPSGKATTVALNVGGGTATKGTDYTYSNEGPLTLPGTQDPGSAAPSATINLIITGDAIDEDDQTVITSLGTLTNAVTSGNTSTTHTIQNDDQAPVISFNTNSTMRNEGDNGSSSNYVYNISITGETEKTMAFNIKLTGSGVVGSDYTTIPAPTGTTVSYANLTATGTDITNIDIHWNGNNMPGPDRTVIMTIDNTTLTNLRAGMASTLTRTHTIRNDD